MRRVTTLLLLSVFCSTVVAQDTTAVRQDLEETEAKLAQAMETVKAATALRDSLTVRKGTLEAELIAARTGATGDITGVVKYNLGSASLPDYLAKGTVVTILTVRSNGDLRVRAADGTEKTTSRANIEWDESQEDLIRVRARERARELREQQQAERERQAEERLQASVQARITERAEKDALRAKGIPIRINSIGFGVNSAGGVEPSFSIENISDKEISYVTFTVVGKNAVGDVLAGNISGNRSHRIRATGPIATEETGSYSFEPVFYANTMACLEVHRAEVEFLDGTKFTMVNDLKEIKSMVSAQETGISRLDVRSRLNLAGECGVIR